MAEFGGMEDNWGLQAVVRGSTSDPFYGVLGWHNDDQNGFDFDFPEDVFQSSRMLKDDLQELYKPFCLISDSASSAPADTMSSISVKNEIKEEAEEIVQQKQLCGEVNTANAQTSKYKRRKNQQKRVVVQSEGLSSDNWAWRKYGQKPIKASPYPRSYYRCSSSKGCLARKQVEQSYTDPSVFIITYTAEHNHTQPTRKNALAGTTRQKFPSPKLLSITDNNKATESKETSSTSSSTDVRVASIEEGCSIRQEINEEILSSDVKMEDEFFAGLEDLDGLISELSSGQHPRWSKMFSMNFCS